MATRIEAEESPGSDVVGFVNKVLNETKKESLESGLSGMSMRLQIMSVDLEEEVEEWLKELKRVAPLAKGEALSVGRLMNAVEDETKGMLRRYTQRKEEEPEALLLSRLEIIRKNMFQVQQILREAQGWEQNLEQSRQALETFRTEKSIEKAETAASALNNLTKSETILRNMPASNERKSALVELGDDLEAALRPQLSEAIAQVTDEKNNELLLRLSTVYEKMNRAEALRTTYANARPVNLHRMWFAKDLHQEKHLASWIQDFFQNILQLATQEATLFPVHPEKTAAAVARAALTPLTASYADALIHIVRRDAVKGLEDAIACKTLGLELSHKIQTEIKCDAKDALQVAIAAASVPFEILSLQHYASAEVALLSILATSINTQEISITTPEALGMVLEEAAGSFDNLFVHGTSASLKRCQILSAGFAGEQVIAAIRTAVAKRLDTLANMLIEPLTAQLISTDGLPLDPSLISDCWAYAKRGFLAVALAGRAERMASNALVSASTNLREWAQRCLLPGQKHNLLLAPTDETSFALFEAKLRLQRDPSARVTLARLKSSGSTGSPLDRLELEASIDRLAAKASGLAFKLAFAPVRAALRRISATRAPFDQAYDAQVVAYCEPVQWFGKHEEIRPSHYVTIVGEHLASALAELELDRGVDLQDALACRLDAAGRATDGAEWDLLGDTLELNDSDRLGLRYLASGDPIEGLTLPRLGAQAELDAFSADAKRQEDAADDEPAQRFATRWLIYLQRATVAAFIDELIRVPNMDDQGAAQLTTDLTYLKHVLSVALDLKPHALLDHLLVLSQASTKRDLDDIIRRQLPPNSAAANVLTKIEIAFATTRACNRL
eukprot:CAMPEP_0197315358 /NCGR_PEP_ID=MMETSP0891-20130614/37883_1 /TAXON_ID=44058 ORGANISM="Aureoumbra lagunensis, Strain CCMP1510" /NCGR_SAMPLE_ID=MMETSP0891 /ASSEMBLY_ACC=CAM_ASM_000534 /LENGTH=845 /DNA_ID=CAMNT_0042804267 /DNA_START=13 /DNA_END=2550 /DNA_ORIENTATION=-